MMFAGTRFCPHCGARAEELSSSARALADDALPCPNCKLTMKPLVLRHTPLQECDACHGIWIDAASFERICADRERQADVLGAPSQEKPRRRPPYVRYRPCPQCERLMNRLNFAHISGVVVDVCKGHGIWFDRDELRHIVEFIREGGMELSRGKLAEKASEKQREAAAKERIDAMAKALGLESDDDRLGAFFAAGTLLGRLTRGA